MTRLYHGSTKVVGQPILGVGNPYNDYGLGFYCTEEVDMAREWASTSEDDGFVNCYDLDVEGLEIFDLESSEYHILNWLAILMQNRVFRVDGQLAKEAEAYVIERFLPDYAKADVICGYRADDSYFSFASAFLNGGISVEQLARAMRLGKLGIQIVPCSERAFGQIKFIEAQPVDSSAWYPRKAQRDAKARASFKEMKRRAFSKDEHYAIDMLREGWDDDAVFLR